MKVNRNSEIKEEKVKEEGAKGVTKKALIGPEDNSQNIIMRYFKIFPGGYTPRHRHNYEHLVKIEKGEGIIINEEGREVKVTAGQSVFIEPNELHQFKNSFKDNFEFVCVIPNPNKK
jgi:quercetin dioxygenase-like cupin family protein